MSITCRSTVRSTIRDTGFICLLLAAGSTIHADEHPHHDETTNTLTVPSVEAQGQPGRFQNLVLEPDGDDRWRVADVDEGVLLDAEHVERVMTVSTQGAPVQYILRLSGTFPDACPAIGRVTQIREGNTFDVHVYYAWNDWLRDPQGVTCAQVLTPFEVTVALDMYGLPAGDYALRVNGHAVRTFTLERDNVAPLNPGSGGDQPSVHCSVEPNTGSIWSARVCNYETDHTL